MTDDLRFDELLREDAAALPPPADGEITPWRTAMDRILWGMGLTTITLNFLWLDVLLPAIGAVLLVLGFRTGLPRQRRARTALRVMTALLGGSTGSRLFTNVRERLGCCYYCGARVNLLTGILLIECGLEEANRERLQSAILAEIADLAAGHITPQELSHIKLAFQSSLCSIGDSLARTEGWYLSGLLQGDPITPQQDMEEIASITAEEVAAAAAALTLDTVFFLQAIGKEDGCDED